MHSLECMHLNSFIRMHTTELECSQMLWNAFIGIHRNAFIRMHNTRLYWNALWHDIRIVTLHSNPFYKDDPSCVCRDPACHLLKRMVIFVKYFTHGRVTPHTWTRHVTSPSFHMRDMNESRHTQRREHERVTSHTWTRHVTSPSAHMRDMSHVTYIVTSTNESRHTHEWVTSHI